MNREDLLGDLTKWQAFNHSDFEKRKPEELFAQPFLHHYHRLHSDLWDRIIRVHGTIQTLETMESFPFEHIYGPYDMEFWKLVYDNFFEMVIVLLHGLTNDQGSDKHTLSTFKNKISQANWLDHGLQDRYKKILRDYKTDSDVQRIGKYISTLRHTYIAHRLIEKSDGSLKETDDHVSLNDLRCVFDAIHKIFAAISFGGAYITLAGDQIPSMINGKPKQTCLDSVLDAIVKDCDLVHEPERNQYWAHFAKYKPSDEISNLNKLRLRIGLPEIKDLM